MQDSSIRIRRSRNCERFSCLCKSGAEKVRCRHYMKTNIPTKKYAGMLNKRMEEKLNSGDAIDVSNYPRDEHGRYKLTDFIEGMDYCNAKDSSWIWSIGQHLTTGQILASHRAEFYENPQYKCLWLR